MKYIGKTFLFKGQRAQPQASPATATIYQHIEIPSAVGGNTTPSPSPMGSGNMNAATLPHHHSRENSGLAGTIDSSAVLTSPVHRRSTSNTSLKSSANATTITNSMLHSPTQRYRNLSLPSHLTNPSVSSSKSLTSGNNTNDYKLQQHTPIKNAAVSDLLYIN